MDVATDPLWRDFWRVAERRSEPPRVGAIGRTYDELFEAARARRATGLVPQSVAHAQAWPHLAFVEVRNVPASTLAIAWRSDDHQPAVHNFVNLATDFSTLSPSAPTIHPAPTLPSPGGHPPTSACAAVLRGAASRPAGTQRGTAHALPSRWDQSRGPPARGALRRTDRTTAHPRPGLVSSWRIGG
jgi:hypothetical protein